MRVLFAYIRFIMRKIYLLSVIVFLHAPLLGQHSFTLTMNHVALSVTDVNRSAEFYGDVLHLQEITNRTNVDGIRWFALGDGKELHLISTLKEKVTVNKAVHLALTTPDFDAFVTNLQRLTIPYSDWPGTPQKISIRADGIKQIFLQDPDGYWLEVNSVAER